MRRELEYRYEGEGTRKYIDILLLFTCWPVEAVHQAVSICVQRRAFSDEAVKSVLSYQPPSLGESYCQKLWIGRACGYDVDGIKEESVSSG